MSVGHHAKSAVLWNGAFILFREVLLRVGLVLVVRQLVSAADYGIADFVNKVTGWLMMFSFREFVAYTVQAREGEDPQWQNHFTGGAFFQGVMFLVINFVAVGVRWLPDYAASANCLHAMSVAFLLDWPCELRRKMLERQFAWGRLRVLHAIGITASAVLTVYAALMDAGPYTLLLPGLVVTLPFMWDLFVTAGWRPDWTWSWRDFRPAWRFGWARVGIGLAFRSRQLAESAAVVALFGWGDAGIFSFAVVLAQMACAMFSEQLFSAIYPVLTRVNPTEENISRVNALMLRVVACVVIPAAVGAAVVVAPLLELLFRGKWTATIPLLPAAMFAGAIAALAQATTTLLLARNQLRQCLLANFTLLGGTLVALGLALPLGLRSYLLAMGCLNALVLALMTFWLIRSRALALGGIGLAVGPAVLGSVLAYVCGWQVQQIFGLCIDRVPSLAGYIVLFVAIYLAVLRLMFARQLREILAYAPGGKWIGRAIGFGKTA